MWELWKHRNAVVFNGVSPSVTVVVQRIKIEGCAWKQAGLLKAYYEAFIEALSRWDLRD